MTPDIQEITVKGKNLYRVNDPEAQKSKWVLNFNPQELIKNTTLDFENLSFGIQGDKETVTFSRKLRNND